MIFIIMFFIALIALILLLVIIDVRHVQTEQRTLKRWYRVNWYGIGEIASDTIRDTFKKGLRKLLHHAIDIYRWMQKKITVRSYLRKKIRSFLYDFDHPRTSDSLGKIWGDKKK